MRKRVEENLQLLTLPGSRRECPEWEAFPGHQACWDISAQLASGARPVRREMLVKRQNGASPSTTARSRPRTRCGFKTAHRAGAGSRFDSRTCGAPFAVLVGPTAMGQCCAERLGSRAGARGREQEGARDKSGYKMLFAKVAKVMLAIASTQVGGRRTVGMQMT